MIMWIVSLISFAGSQTVIVKDGFYVVGMIVIMIIK